MATRSKHCDCIPQPAAVIGGDASHLFEFSLLLHRDISPLCCYHPLRPQSQSLSTGSLRLVSISLKLSPKRYTWLWHTFVYVVAPSIAVSSRCSALYCTRFILGLFCVTKHSCAQLGAALQVENPFMDLVFQPPTVERFALRKSFKGHLNSVSAVAFHPRKVGAGSCRPDTTRLRACPVRACTSRRLTIVSADKPSDRLTSKYDVRGFTNWPRSHSNSSSEAVLLSWHGRSFPGWYIGGLVASFEPQMLEGNKIIP